MVLLDHMEHDLAPLNNTHCLLKSPASFRKVLMEAQEDGVYGFWDANKCIWIRIGMVAGRPIVEREKEHKKCAIKQTTDSKFYRSYPSKEADKVYHAGRMGFFESLECYSALALPLHKSINQLDSAFALDDCLKSHVNKLNFKAPQGTVQTGEYKLWGFLHYSGELAYGLCLASGDNVSTNPGMEPVIGYYGN